MLDDQRYRAVQARDARFDGVFYTAVRTTGIFCRPSCPAVTPRRHNVSFFATPAAAVAAGYRACRRCRPDTTPGSPQWNVRGDLVARAMRLIGDGVVEREGVEGLARRLGYSVRHVHRALSQEVGAGPVAIARSNRAQLARTLIETTDLPLADIAFAAGFGSIRQFNDTMRQTYAVSPRQLRRGPRGAGHRLSLRLPVRRPFDAAGLLDFLRPRAIEGVETVGADSYARICHLPHGPAVVRVRLASDHVRADLELTDLADTQAAVQRCRRLLDLDADPLAIDTVLGADPALAELVRSRPGIRLPGQVDGFEVVVRAVVGQQVSVAGARTILGRIAARFGDDVELPFATELGLVRAFPRPEQLAGADPASFSMPRARAAAFLAAAEAMASGGLVLDPGADRAEAREQLLALPGIGPWTADYIVLRALSDPDVLLPTDLVLRRALTARGLSARDAERWRPWRSYAALHLWHAAADERMMA